MERYTFGIDFGTDSVRAVLVNTRNGQEMAIAVKEYPRWKAGMFCNPQADQYRQHPLDYLESMESAIRQCVDTAGPEIAAQVVGLSVDTTASTPVAVDRTGTPLSLLPGFAENPNAMFVLWKDHTANTEAGEINRHAENFEINYLQYVGGIYSSEWFWSKILHIYRRDEAVRKAVYTWVEHCDWIPFVLTGGHDADQIKRGVCAAGHKALWAQEFGGFPPNEFFSSLDPLLDGLVETVGGKSAGAVGDGFTDGAGLDASQPAGVLSTEWARRLGLPATVKIGIGVIDCHMGAIGGQIEPYYLSKVIGTSTCDILVAPAEDMHGHLVRGICGQVRSSVIPGMIGLEAGQSAFGDIYAWFKNLLAWPLRNILNDPESAGLAAKAEEQILSRLNQEAAQIEVTEELEWAVDWWNGRRTPDADLLQTGSIHGLRLGSDAPRLFRALAEATAFGSKSIIERFISEGIPIKGVIALGGISRKSDFIMQMMADVIGMPIRVHRSEQTCAIGGAMFAATVAGVYERVEDAMKAMGQGFDKEYLPDPTLQAIYQKRYERYRQYSLNSKKGSVSD